MSEILLVQVELALKLMKCFFFFTSYFCYSSCTLHTSIASSIDSNKNEFHRASTSWDMLLPFWPSIFDPYHTQFLSLRDLFASMSIVMLPALPFFHTALVRYRMEFSNTKLRKHMSPISQPSHLCLIFEDFTLYAFKVELKAVIDFCFNEMRYEFMLLKKISSMCRWNWSIWCRYWQYVDGDLTEESDFKIFT